MDDSLFFVELNNVQPTICLIRAKIDINPEEGELPDHFPSGPVVPAYMQLQWVERILNYKAPALQVMRFAEVKFLLGIVPPCSVIIEILSSKLHNFEFRIFADESDLKGEKVVFSKGKIFCKPQSY